ncbi:hypothetical protein [Raoultella planticola]|uniref:Uncharacterized protein n=1 Tax=Raoultella planticola TaxID=575 RepID=A0A485A5B4_RAOPL|nr:hypothetical protein [Raoultella planticola]KFD04284.1 hypothetical protein GRPL_04306 [Raoultella planticola ATCC 33531]VFS56082.1 Uncharacterised protein [Raoultella planticola]
MNIETVNELIQSLESAGELSIREQKFLKLAKAFKQMAAENVVQKESRNNLAEFIHEELDADYPLNMNLETPATDSIVAGIKADGVEEFAAKLRIPGDDPFLDAVAEGVAGAADDYAKKMREGAK